MDTPDNNSVDQAPNPTSGAAIESTIDPTIEQVTHDEQISTKELMRRRRKQAYQKQKLANKELREEQKEAVRLEKQNAKQKKDALLKSLLKPASELPEKP
jgi:hypothetical protein